MSILSIIIPSYNRAESLQKQVRALLPQLTPDVCLTVIDNKSQYDVSLLFTNEEKQQFTLLVNNINIGGAANISKCFELCKTKWLWTLSDDDIVKSDAVDNVLSSIEGKDESIMVNFYELMGGVYQGLDQFAKMSRQKSAYCNLFWMSRCIYNMDIFRDYMHVYNRALSTMQPGVVTIVRILEKHPQYKVELVETCICKDDGGSISWNRETFIYASLYILDLLHDLKRRLNRSLFDSIFFMCLEEIRLSRDAGMSFFHSIRLYFAIIFRFGMFNSLLCHGTTIARHCVRIIRFRFSSNR